MDADKAHNVFVSRTVSKQTVTAIAQAQGKNHIRGILYAWLLDDDGGPSSLQSCDITKSI